MPTKRIEHIDALRGFTMILVVFAHVELFGFFDNSGTTIISRIFSTFRMPTFFFISGYIAYKQQKWDFTLWAKMILKKTQIQVFPTLFFGLIYTYLISNTTFVIFLKHEAKLGYWFTLVLLEMYIILYTTNLIAEMFAKNNLTTKKRLTVIFLIGISILLYYLKTPFLKHQSLQIVGDYFCFHKLFLYFMYFALGHIAAIHKDLFMKLLDNQYLCAIIIIIYSITLYIFITIDDANMNKGWERIYRAFQGPILGTTGLLILYNFFRKYQKLFAENSFIGKGLQTIGKRTLDIYLLHYFFIPSLPLIGTLLLQGKIIVVELFIGLSISLAIIILCFFVSNIIRTSDLLGHYLFGAKRPHNQPS